MTLRPTVWLAVLLVVAGCGAAADPPSSGAAAPEIRQGVLQGAERVGGKDTIAVEVRDVATVGRSVRFRGRATNHYGDSVDGIAYRLRLFSTDGERTLRTEYDESDVEVAPGATEPFEMELQSMYFTTVPRFTIDAIPQRVGGREIAPPADW